MSVWILICDIWHGEVAKIVRNGRQAQGGFNISVFSYVLLSVHRRYRQTQLAFVVYSADFYGI